MTPEILLAEIRQKTLVFTVTSGRSGTKLLTVLLRDAGKFHAEHEPAPRVNFVARSFLECPEAAEGWLLTEKLPAVLDALRSDIYIETSHLVSKCLIEPMLRLGIEPAFIILRRNPKDVAKSLYQIDCIPDRTGAGRLVLLRPTDSQVVAPNNWQTFTDYQMCYWYALEVQRRQIYYASYFSTRNLRKFEIDYNDLTDLKRFTAMCEFVSQGSSRTVDKSAFENAIKVNQNPRHNLVGTPRSLPANIEQQEIDVDNSMRNSIES